MAKLRPCHFAAGNNNQRPSLETCLFNKKDQLNHRLGTLVHKHNLLRAQEITPGTTLRLWRKYLNRSHFHFYSEF